MIEKLNSHYSMNNPASVYDEEALTALELAGRTAKKVNEVIEQSNNLDNDTRKWMQTTEEKTIPEGVKNEVQNHINNGSFDKQIDENISALSHEYAESLNGLNTRVDNLLNNIPSGSTTMDAEVVDGRVGHDNIVHSNIGNAMRNQVRMLGEASSHATKTTVLKFTDMVDGEYYSNTNGGWGVSAKWRRSRYKIPCSEHLMFVCDAYNGATIFLHFYDENCAYISTGYIGKSRTTGNYSRMTPTGTAFVSLTVDASYTQDSFTLTALNNDHITTIQYPFDEADKGYMFFPNYWVSNSGAWQNANTVSCVVIPVKGVKYVGVNTRTQSDGVFYDTSCQLISNLQNYEDYGIRHRIFTVPDNAGYVVINFLNKTFVDNTEGHLDEVISLIREPATNPLMNKKVLVIGDSIAWIDGRYGYGEGSEQRCLGFQNYLHGRGARVDTQAFSGWSYTKDAGANSIYDGIVTSGYDVSKYDYVVLFGGSNDVRISAPIGSVGETYGSKNTNPSTMSGAVGGLIYYILANNPKCRIYLCSVIPCQASSHSYKKDKQYRDALKEISEMWGIPFIDLFTLMGVTINVNHTTFLYDDTHPNYKGMKRIGTIIQKFIENTAE